MDRFERNYNAIAHAATRLAGQERESVMRETVDLLWDALHRGGVSWVGFYIDHPERPKTERLVLGPCRDKPACSPIGLHGVCGKALLSASTRIIEDVASLGPAYIACDPRDRSEIVVPLIDQQGVCWGVLDLDSHETGAFSQSDDDGLRAVLMSAGLLHQ